MNKKVRKFSWDYYRVEVPQDFCDSEERARIAFSEAESRIRIWAIPCNWSVISDDGETVVVCRKRYNSQDVLERVKHSCTCNEFDWYPEPCPFKDDYHGDATPCRCCPVCRHDCKESL